MQQKFIQLDFNVKNPEQAEMLVALLTNAGFEGFEEQPERLIAVIPADQYEEQEVVEIVHPLAIPYNVQEVMQQNWNAVWESDFQPVVVKGFCTVRAGFHPPATDTPYEVIITPKMSFGTGHHATTQLMMETMQELPFPGQKVLDFGTGTGILAILAKKLDAATVCAIDHDEWSVENAEENARLNHTELIIEKGSLEDMPEDKYGIILANINRNILLQYMGDMTRQLLPEGMLVVSGILEEDQPVIEESAVKHGVTLKGRKALNGWISLSFYKASAV